MIEREGRVINKVMPDRGKKSLAMSVARNVEPEAQIVADMHPSYDALDCKFDLTGVNKNWYG